MSDELYAFVLKNILNEIRSVCPDVSHAFVFKEDGKILARDENTDEETIRSAVDAFEAIAKRADAIGGIESVIFSGANDQVKIASVNDFYLTITASKEADEKYVNTLTRVLVPTMLKLVQKIQPVSVGNKTFTTLEPEPVGDIDAEEIAEDAGVCEKELPAEETVTTEPIEEQAELEVNPEPLLPEPPVNQLIVETLGGLLSRSDTVRIDSAVIVQWKNLYADKRIEEVDVETLDGNTTRCKFKPIKDSKHGRKGIVQIPEKLQDALQTTKGELVMVKPVVE